MTHLKNASSVTLGACSHVHPVLAGVVRRIAARPAEPTRCRHVVNIVAAFPCFCCLLHVLATLHPSVLTDVAKGLKHCHDHHVVVCDVKPENVILVHDGTRYVGKVADFGLAMGERRLRKRHTREFSVRTS